MANIVYRGPGNTTQGNAAEVQAKDTPLTTAEINQNFFGLNADIQTRLPKAGGTLTGNVVVDNGTGQVTLSTDGSITTIGATATTGTLWLGNSGTKGLKNLGTKYELPVQGLDVGGAVNAPSYQAANWGVTNGVNTGAVNATIGTTTYSWLVSCTSSGTFKGGLQTSDASGSMRLYAGTTKYLEVESVNGNVVGLGTLVVPGIKLANGSATAYGSTEFFSGATRQGYIGTTTADPTQDNGTLKYVSNVHQFLGDLTTNATFTLPYHRYRSSTATTSSTTLTTIATFDRTIYRSADFTIQATEGTNFQCSKVVAIHNDVGVDSTEYSTVVLGSVVGAFSVAYDAINNLVLLQVTATSTNATTYKISSVMTKV